MTNTWRVLIVALCAQFGISMVDLAIPTLAGFLKADFGLTAATVGLVIAAFPFGKILSAYFAGRAADRVGERRVLLIGGIGTSVCVLFAAVSPLPLIVLFLIAAGAAGSTATPAGGRFILNTFRPERRGFANGLRQMATPGAGVVAAVLLPPLASVTTWRVSLAVAAGITLIGIVPLAAVRIGGVPRDRALEPGTPPGKAANRNVWLLTVWGSLLATGQFALLAFLALDLHQSTELTLPTASLLLGVALGAGALCRIGWGVLSDHALASGRKPFLLAVNAAAAVGSLLLFVTPRSSPTLILGVVAVIAGLALVGFQGLWVTMIAEVADPLHVGAATGIAVGFTTAAATVSPPVFGLVADLTGTYRSIWALVTILVVAAFVPAFLVSERAREGVLPGKIVIPSANESEA